MTPIPGIFGRRRTMSAGCFGVPSGRLVLLLLMLAGAVGRGADSLDVPCPEALLPSGETSTPGWFESLVATPMVEERRIAVTWVPPGDAGAAKRATGTVEVLASTGRPGHWLSRDWRRWKMEQTASGWRAVVPVETVDEPIAYYVRHLEEGRSRVSPVRLFRTPGSELLAPTFVFTGFLDGFEEGIAGWEPVAAALPETAVTHSQRALTGRGALRLEVPAGRASVTVGTVRIQGWMLLEHAPVAVRFAARLEDATGRKEDVGRIGCALHGNARTPDVAIYPTLGEFTIGREWRRLEIPIEAFTGLRPGTVDWFTIQFRADSGRALLVDDLELVPR
jgi:hypothetical protein